MSTRVPATLSYGVLPDADHSDATNHAAAAIAVATATRSHTGISSPRCTSAVSWYGAMCPTSHGSSLIAARASVRPRDGRAPSTVTTRSPSNRLPSVACQTEPSISAK